MKCINHHEALEYELRKLGILEWGMGYVEGEVFRTRRDLFVFCVLLPYTKEQRRRKARKRGVHSYIEPFAWMVDYHRDVREILERLLNWLKNSSLSYLYSDDYELCVDTSGYDDRLIAEKCGVGVRGKNGLIINKRYGTQHFIGYVVFQSLPSPPSVIENFLNEGKWIPPTSHCENCDRCVRACPTQALTLGVHKCLSFITQSSDEIEEEMRVRLGDRLYGCSVCQNVCPHNRAFDMEDETKSGGGDSYVDPYEILALSNKEFKRKYGHMGFAWRPVRIYKRNALINIGNTGTEEDISKLDEGSFHLPDEVLKYKEWAKNRIKIRGRKSKICGGCMRQSDRFFMEKIQELKDQGVYRQLPVISGPNNSEIMLNGKKVINLSSNNYLGLANHPKLIEATHKGVDSHGAGAGAVRTIVANTDLLENLEQKLAEFKREEAVVVYQSGFNCNAGTIQAITEKGDLIISDELNHASIIDGVRLSKADKGVFKHSDMEDLERVLKEKRANYRNCLIITDGVFSMDGDIAKLPEIVALAEKYNCMTYVDDAHGSGVLGENGRGTVDHFHLHGKVDFIIGTLSKAIGVVGGYVAGSKLMKDWLLHRGRPILFSTALTPASISAITASVELLASTTEFTDKLWDNAKYFKAELGKYGFNTGNSETPITPVIIGEEAKSLEFSKKLLENGVFVSAIVFPTVPKGTGRVRCMVTAGHTREQIDRAVAAFAKVGREMGIIK